MRNIDGIPLKEIVRALHCMSTPNGDCMGSDCPFYVEEEVQEDMAREIGRVKWPSCDVDDVGMAGAKTIDRLMHEVERRDYLLNKLGIKIGETAHHERPLDFEK